MDFNHADLFEGVADAVPERIALICGHRRLSYAALDAEANRLAHYLDSVGVRPGQHVGMQLYSGVEYAAAILAALKIRAVPVNVNYRYVASELAYIYRDADLVALIYDAEFAGQVAAAPVRCGAFPRPGRRAVRPARRCALPGRDRRAAADPGISAQVAR